MTEKRIWKFELETTDTQTIEMPWGSRILHVGEQNRMIQIWVEVNPGNEKESVHFWVTGTGHPTAELLAIGAHPPVVEHHLPVALPIGRIDRS